MNITGMVASIVCALLFGFGIGLWLWARRWKRRLERNNKSLRRHIKAWERANNEHGDARRDGTTL